MSKIVIYVGAAMAIVSLLTLLAMAWAKSAIDGATATLIASVFVVMAGMLGRNE